MRWPEDPESRRRMVEALLGWVEELHLTEPVPEGIDASCDEEVPDLHGTVAALEALRREVGIQGRAFSKLAEASRREEKHAEEDARRAGRLEVLSKLLEARDRFARNLAVFGRQEGLLSGGFPGGSRRRAAAASFKEGLVLSRDAVDEALRSLDCREIPAEGRSFDPRTMRAVEAAGAGEGKPGTVVEVIRAGWLAGNEVLRPVEVRAVPEEVKAAPRSITEDEE
jgi:molecular chaperone GrpE (heat shock protein)